MKYLETIEKDTLHALLEEAQRLREHAEELLRKNDAALKTARETLARMRAIAQSSTDAHVSQRRNVDDKSIARR